MKVLITGGAGFVGAQLALHLRARGHEVSIMDNLVRRGGEMNLPTFKRHGIRFFHGDVRNREDFEAIPNDTDVICDTSAQPSAIAGYGNPVFDITNNTMGLIHVLEFARTRRCAVIFWSTNKVYSGDRINAIPLKEDATRWTWDEEAIHRQYGDGLPSGFDPAYGFSEELSIDGGQHSIYGLSKVMGDLACQEYAHAFSVPAVVNRFSCLAGEGQFGKSEQGWVAWWAIAFHFGFPLTYMGWLGKQVRDVLFVEDVCRLVEIEMNNMDRIAGEVYNIGGGIGQSLSLLEATAIMQRRFGREVPITVDSEIRKADQCVYISDTRKASRDLGWTPQVSIEEGYDRIIAWIRENEHHLAGLYQ